MFRLETLMALDNLGSSLTNAIKKLFKAGVVDEATVKELVRDIQRALLQSDVNVQLVLEISKRIEERALKEKVPPGISRREHVIKVVYEELTRFVGDKPVPLKVEAGKRKIIMLVGIQGSGKTTHAAKLARYFQKRGLKPALICADTFRPGAYAQLQQLAARINVPIYGDVKEKNANKVVKEGLKQFSDKDLIIVDTSGRHKEEKDLIKEMKDLEKNIKPEEVIMVIDGTIGQQALIQAKTFHEATPIGAIIVTKLDGTSRGGGALSAVAATGFVGRLLGMGDLETLLEKVHDAEIKVPPKKAREIMSGNFTLTDMYEQFAAVKNMGPFKKVLSMIPGMSSNVPDEMLNTAEGRLEKWQVIIQSMTPKEKENPKLLNSSRARRIARGSGTTEKDVKELVKQYFMMRKMLKTFKRKKKLPFGLGGKGGMPANFPVG